MDCKGLSDTGRPPLLCPVVGHCVIITDLTITLHSTRCRQG
jgi:hypothetical protein